MIQQDNTSNDETMTPKNASHNVDFSNNAEVALNHLL